MEQHPHNNAIRILEYVSMNEIICPHCDKAFKVDEAGYANILKQVYDQEFENQLNERLTQVEKDQVSALKLAEKDAKSALQALKSAKDIEVERLLSQIREKESSVQATVDQAVREIERGGILSKTILKILIWKNKTLRMFLRISIKLKSETGMMLSSGLKI